MACLRGICKRVNLLQRRVYPTFGHRFGDDKDETKPVSSPKPSIMINKFFPHIGTERLGSVFLESQCYQPFVRPVGFGLSCHRYMSSTPMEWSNKVDGIDFVATEGFRDEILESVTSQVAPPAINEVAIAAADSAFPIAALQHLIDAVHSFTGLNWWASIALTTVIINGLTLPILLYQANGLQKFHILLPRFDEYIQKILRTKVLDPEEGERMQLLAKTYGVNPVTLFKIYILQSSLFISFTFAIRNMAEKMLSFQTSGAFWFTDLSTPDSTYILPLLTALTLWIRLELFRQEQLLYKGRPNMNLEARNTAFLVLSLPLLQYLENAVFCYWLSSNLFFIVYKLSIIQPSVRKLLNLPEVTISPTPPPSSSSSIMPFSSKKKKN